MSGDLTFNKYAAAILATALGFMLIKEVSHSAMHVSIPDVPAYGADLVVQDAGPEVVIDLPFPQPEFLASMDATKGAKVFKKCTSCHNADDGGKDGTGPNIWDIVGKPAGQSASFAGYSGAMKTSGITWNYEELNDYLTKPKEYVPGTKMNFVGLKKEADRAAVIEYLRVASNTPVAMPIAAAAPAQESAEDITKINEVVAEDDAKGEMIETIVDGTDKAAEKAGDMASDAMDKVSDKAGDIVDGAKDITGNAADAATDVVDTVKDAADTAGDLMDKAKDAVGDKVEDAVKDDGH